MPSRLACSNENNSGLESIDHSFSLTQQFINLYDFGQKKKMWYIHTKKYYLASKMKEILQCTTMWMELEDIVLSEISQS